MRAAIACLLLAVANAGTSPEGRTWLDEKAKEDGVVTRTTGVQNVVSVSSSAAAAAEGPEASKSDAI